MAKTWWSAAGFAFLLLLLFFAAIGAGRLAGPVAPALTPGVPGPGSGEREPADGGGMSDMGIGMGGTEMSTSGAWGGLR
ncbi:hypothetical protein ACFVWZ_13765 [Streptomyces sp. NPDC058200]|uniref:hypothetical protein n=1 Tax=Streptomyces sp. NPDC058200 TaxID=3346378 RepID=UPI0036EB0D42